MQSFGSTGSNTVYGTLNAPVTSPTPIAVYACAVAAMSGPAPEWASLLGKPVLTVSPIGFATCGVENYGADFGPDTPGTSTSGVQEAINVAAAAGSTKSVYLINYGDAYPYGITSQLLFLSHVAVISDGATIVNNGGLQYPFATPNNLAYYRGKIKGLILDGNSVNGSQCLTLISPQRSEIDVFIKNAPYGCAILTQTIGTPFEAVLKNNAALNRFRFQFDNILQNTDGSGAVGLSLQGSSSAVVTDNTFEEIFATNVYGIGVQIVEWADSNYFENVLVSLVPNSHNPPTNNPIGVILNNVPPYTTNVGVYDNRFAKLSVDAFGFPSGFTGVTGILFNYTYQNVVSQFYTSPGPTTPPFPGTRYDFNQSQSHFFRDMYHPGTPPTSGVTYQFNM
ncbi:MAG TPA: hypothetical protein VGV64_07985 [Thermoplasmata archaeon]|nr:hypothetical protein [Thermoplasmata archaeon]